MHRAVGEHARRPRRAAPRARGRRCRAGARSPSPGRAGRCRTGPRTAAARPSGLPKCRHSVTVLLPPWVITASTCGRIEVWGRNSSPAIVVGQPQQLVLRALGDDHAVRGVGERVDEPLHQLDVGGAQRAEREVDERALALGQHRRQLPRRVGRADARLQVEPVVAERAGARVVGLVRIQREVEPRRLVHELELGQRAGAALLAQRARTRRASRRGCARTPPSRRPTASGRRPGSRRTAAGRRGRGPRSGCRRRSAPTAGRSRAAPGRRRRCPRRSRRAAARR